MPDLVGAKRVDNFFKFVVVKSGKPLRLFGVVFVDYFLDRFGAGHGRIVTHSGCGGTQRVTGRLPNRRQCGWPHATFKNQPIECVEMVLFLLGHAFDGLGSFSMAQSIFQDGELTLINMYGTLFARMIDADYLFDQIPGGTAR